MATVVQLRTLFAELLGRRNLDLDTTLCDRLFNQACVYLDSKVDRPRSNRRFFAKPASGEYVIAVDGRAVAEVWVSNGESRYKLDYADPVTFKAEALMGSLDPDVPVAYTLGNVNLAAAHFGDTESDFETAEYDAEAYSDIDFTGSEAGMSIVVMPPTDGTWTFDILLKENALAFDANAGQTENWWSVNYPYAVLYAAASFLAAELGNAPMAEHWMTLADSQVGIADRGVVESEMAPYEDCMWLQG